MFPDIRLMIAAVLATVVVLICGFGMFAAFRVSHEPLVRLPAASIPIELSGDDTVTSTEDPFDRRFQISVAMLTVSRTSNVSAQPQDQRNDAYTGAATLAAPSAPAVTEPSTAPPADAGRAAGEPIDQAAPEAPQPDQAPAETAAAPEPGDEQTPVVSAPQGEPTPPAPAPPDAASETEHQPPATIAAEPARTPTAAAVVATELPSEGATQSADQAPAASKPPVRSADKASDKAAKAKPARVARIHRVRRVATAFRLQPSDQVTAFGQPNFQTAAAPAPWPVVARRPTRVRLVRAAPEKAKRVAVVSDRVKKLATTKVNKAVASDNAGKTAADKANQAASEKANEPEAGIGGPFVAPPGPLDSQTPPNPLTPPNQ